MPLMPKRTKYRKQQKGRIRGKATRGNKVTDGEFGLQSQEIGLITSNQIEAARVAMTRYIKRGGKVWIKIFPDKPITSKPIGTRMGKGKGAVEYWVAAVKPGRVMFEIAGVSEEIAREALRLAMNKLPIKCKFVAKLNFNLNNSVFSSPNSFSRSGEDISLILFIFIIFTYLFRFSCYKFCFVR